MQDNLENIEKIKKLTQKGDRVVVSREIPMDRLTPCRVFQTLAKDKNDAVLLDSLSEDADSKSCTYIGLEPMAEFIAHGRQITITDNHQSEKIIDNPFQQLRKFYHRFRVENNSLAKFAGGIIGFLAYDAIRHIENIPDRHKNENNVPDICFKFYATHLVFDYQSQKITIAKVINLTDDINKDYLDAKKLIDEIIATMIFEEYTSHQKNKNMSSNIEVDIDDKTFMKMVKQAKKFIARGEFFQIVISRQFKQSFSGNAFDIYRALHQFNPASYQFYLRYPEFTLVGSSPERLVSLQKGIIETMPIAGTRPRGVNPQQDLVYENELKNDKKELAEHMMLVDLSRNDIGSMAIPGSVNITQFSEIHRYHKVMHLVSCVQGKLRENLDAFDVLRAAFPAGTLSGAPKIRAMELIDEIETSRRGIYGGAICAIDNHGHLDSCITIRTAFIKNGIATVRAGAGVVMDSDPKKEAEETKQKAQGILEAIALAQRGFA